jgi:penicillin-binding protein 2
MPATSTRFRDHWQEQRLFLTRIIAAAVIIAILSGVLVARLVMLQIVEYERFAALSLGNRFRLEPLPPTRGLIYDRHGLVIAENLPNWELVAIAEEIDNLDGTLKRLEELGLVDAGEHKNLRDLVRSHRGFERVKLSNLTEEQAATFAVRRHRFPGVDIQEGLARHYPFAEATAQAVGYVSSISLPDLERIDRSDYAATSHIGKTGIERAYEGELHGHVGFRHQVVNAQGRLLYDPAAEKEADASEIPGMPKSRAANPGNNVVLSIDMRLQLAAQAALGDSRGTIVAIDPRNGDVLVLVSTPAFDANRFAEGISRSDYNALNNDQDHPLFNRALQGVYPPGSTVKPFLALAALEDESISPDKEMYCPGEYHLPGQTHKYREGRGGVHGSVNLHEAIARSCDVFFYQLALAMGIDNIANGLKRFGFGAPTGLGIVGEEGGVVPSPQWKKQRFARAEDQVWFPGETINTGVGQGYVLVTPIQLASAVATMAARGARFKPRLLLGSKDGVTGETTWTEPTALPNVEGPTAAQWQFVHDAMVGVTAEPRGTAHTAMQGTAYKVAGKTGTAQLFTVAQDEKYREADVDARLRDNGLFIAFAPADSPRIALAVVVENGGGGARSAAPVARKVLDAYFDAEGYVARDP